MGEEGIYGYAQRKYPVYQEGVAKTSVLSIEDACDNGGETAIAPLRTYRGGLPQTVLHDKFTRQVFLHIGPKPLADLF